VAADYIEARLFPAIGRRAGGSAILDRSIASVERMRGTSRRRTFKQGFLAGRFDPYRRRSRYL